MEDDQNERKNWQVKSDKEKQKLLLNDLYRRKQVAKIFAEGCFKTSTDFFAAALIYQHGDMPDHYYQAFIWSKRAADLGNSKGKEFSALAIDRYLISIGKKQLFGSQFFQPGPNKCFCMQPVEATVSEDFRKNYSGRTLQDNFKAMATFNKKGCPQVECDSKLESTPKGSIPGLW